MGANATRIVIEPHWLTLDTIGVTGALTATVIDAAGDTLDAAQVTWASADTGVATVDTAGVVTSVALGKTRVAATHDSATAQATVEVALPLTDREILEILYEAAGGDRWAANTNWLSDEDLSEWHGVDTDGDGKVTDLSLRANGLTDTIPVEIGGLNRLGHLDLSYNGITGSLPAELGKLARLRRLEVNNNELGGGLPREMGGMEALVYLDVAHNNTLGGGVPHTFAGLELETFYSTDTGLCTPPSLKAWFDGIPRTDNPAVCTGRIALNPSSLYFEAIGDTATLSAMAMTAEGDTLLNAVVTWTSADTGIARVASTGLVTAAGYGATQVAATADSLTGMAEVEIVFALSDREVLEILHTSTGGGNWTDTTNWLSDQALSEWSGVATNEAGKVVGLSLANNNLTGKIPEELGELDDLTILDLGRNSLAGTLPGHLGALQQLRDLLLDGNAIEGLLPRDLGSMAGLRYLHVGDNKLRGVVPGSFANLELDTLYTAGSGVCVPPSLGEWFDGIEQTDDAMRCAASIAIEVGGLESPTFYAIGETATLSASYVNAEGDTLSSVPVIWSSADTTVVSVDEAGTVAAVGDGETTVTAAYDSISASIDVVVDLPDSDRDVLAILFDRARGEGWTDATNWLSERPLSEWTGVRTDDGGRVVSLSLAGNNLRGPLHSSIGRLDRLITLDLSRNWISGPVPAEFGNLTLLRHLALSVNAIGGNLPSALGRMDSLQTLKVAGTSVSGRIPTSFAALDLDTLHSNGTTICVPPSLSAWLDSIPETDNPPACTSRILVEPASPTFRAVGDTARLSATVIDAEGNILDDAVVTWTTADATVARVDTTGLVTARASGVTTVTATYDSVTAASVDAAVRLPGSDRDALEALYRATGGDDWGENGNWMSDEPLGAWYGVTTTDAGRVRRLNLPGNNLAGTIPAAIGLLDSLVHVDLYNNALTGPIPTAIGRLQRVERLFLGHNELSGSLPAQMGNMAGLRHLEINATRLEGRVPAVFADLRLKHFFAHGSEVCLPRSLGDWFRAIEQRDSLLPCIPVTADRDVLVEFYNSTGGPDWGRKRYWLSDKSLNTWQGIATDDEGYVTEVFLPWNGMTDSIPPRLGDLARLEVLSLYGNELTGRIPPELGKLTGVRDFSLSGNNLEGPIPPELGNLVNVKEIFLSNNELTGPIPSEFGNLMELELLWLFNNRLSGPIPPELGNLKKLRQLAASDNRLTGPLPPEIGDLESLRWLILHTNRLGGPLPPELGRLSKLELLWLGANRITGPLPSELGNLQALKDFSVWVNRMDGPIPPELGNMSSLEHLVLSDNRFSGSIPPELGKLSNLEHLGLYENRLTGAIPPELGDLSSLVDFWLSENQLTGPLPAELGKLSAVEDFGVQDNRLSGSIPPEFGRMSSLVQLALHTNNLSGPLPSELGNLRELDDLRLQDNPDLAGLLPRSMLNLPLGHLEIQTTDLCPQLDDEFQEWVDGIAYTNGLGCPNTRIEGFALAELYGATGGDSWTDNSGWDDDSALGSRYGITVAAGDGLVRQIRIPGNGLRGPLPHELGSLRRLEVLDLADNHLTGGIGAPVASIDALDTIRVSGNEDMAGPLPFKMAEMPGLKALQYAETDLCASPSTTFQAWIGGLDVADGATCENPDAVKLSLPVVYLTQAIQGPTGDVPLLSGREALLRVFLVSDQVAFFEPEVVATFTRDGEEVHRVVMESTQDRLATSVDESGLLTSYNAEIPAEHMVPGTEMVVLADSAETIPRAEGSRSRYPHTGSAALEVIEVPPLELTVVPVLNAENPDSSILPWIDNIGELGAESPHVGLFRYSFPFSEFSARSREPYVTSLDLTNEELTWDMILELEPVYRAEKATGYWYAVADSDDGYVRGIARLNGMVSFGKPWDTELAHEVGHNLDLLHAPCGGALGTDADFPYPNGSIGVWGYDFRDGSLVSPERRRDIMGYCYDRGWLSDYYFQRVIRVRANKDETWTNGDLSGAGPEGEMLVLWGGVMNGELRIKPVHSMTTTPKLPAEGGAYRIEGFGRGGRTEFSLSFTPGEDQYGNKYFFFAVPIEGDWEVALERITLAGPEGEVSVDRNDPRSLTIVTDPATGRIRAILRDWNQALPAALGDTRGLEVVTTRGIVEAVRLRR